MSSTTFFERLESFVIFVVRVTFRVAAKVLFSFSLNTQRTAKRSTDNNKVDKIHTLIKHLREIERHEELSVKLAIVRRQLYEEKMKNIGCIANGESGACVARSHC